MALSATPLYAGLLGLILCYISVQVIRQRIKHGVGLLDGGVDDLSRYIRAQANFIEYVPMVLLLMCMAEIQGVSVYAIHLIGIALVVGRIMHYVSMTSIEPKTRDAGKMVIKYRQFGMMSTFGALIIASCAVIAGMI